MALQNRLSTVHPHTRGEQALACNSDFRSVGSSPHTWGTDTINNINTRADRFIPTHVGNRDTRTTLPENPTVHPHTRGEQDSCCQTDHQCDGSSPHTWGTGSPHSSRPRQLRFIPTHVGNSKKLAAETIALSVHPHTRGEQGDTAASVLSTCGSSPHTWGTGAVPRALCPCNRFIPTHVGNSQTG